MKTRECYNGPTKMARILSIGTVFVLLIAGYGCTPDALKEGASSVQLQIVDINTSNGDYLNSDVLQSDGVFEDSAQITILNWDKNPEYTTSTFNVYNDVILKQYEVRYFRTDGRNVEGVDVPYRITGPLSGVVARNSRTTISIEIVRHQAKEEPPLRNLRGGGALNMITCIAEIAVYGETYNGETLKTTAQLQVNFADFQG